MGFISHKQPRVCGRIETSKQVVDCRDEASMSKWTISYSWRREWSR